MPDFDAILAISMDIAIQDLTDGELAGLNLTAQFGLDPRGLPHYEKIRHLFTEENGTRMHDQAKETLYRAVLQRLGGQG
jgi:hypothetical protein